MTTLTIGDAAPDFTLPNSSGDTVSLSDFAPGRVVLYFYPAALTPGCTAQAVDFTANLGDFEDHGMTVVGISPDSIDKLAQFAATEHITFPLLSDDDRSVLKSYGAFGEKTLYGKTILGVLRSTFVIDVDDAGKGTIALAQYNVRAAGHVEKLKRDLGL
ncbi:MAG: peroxiredoxin [Propionibacteriaceae bacterium]